MRTKIVSLDHLSALAARGAAPTLRECVRAVGRGQLWDIDTGISGHDSIGAEEDAETAMAVVCDHAEITSDEARRRGWSVRAVGSIRGQLFGRCPLEVVPAGDAARVTLELPRPTAEEAEGLPRIGGSYDHTALDCAVAGALGISPADLANPAATNLLDGGMLWTWEAVV